MGTKRFLLKQFLPYYDTVRTAQFIRESGIKEGLRKKDKEDFCEDNPFTAPICRDIKYDGEIEGIIKTSKEYEKKISALKEEFLKEQQDAEKEVVAYRNLLDECENVIEELENN